MMIWKKKSKIWRLKQSIKDFGLFIKLLSYCLKCRKNADSKNLKVATTKKTKIMLLSKCVVCDSKKSRFIKEQEASGLLSSFWIKTYLSKNSFSRSSFVPKILTS